LQYAAANAGKSPDGRFQKVSLSFYRKVFSGPFGAILKGHGLEQTCQRVS